MFYYVNGTVAETGPNLAVIDCGGVGYACATTNYTLSQLKKGERAKLYTHLHVREDIFELYGFSSQAELNSFRMLIGISGVGPKAALSVLSATTPQNLALSIGVSVSLALAMIRVLTGISIMWFLLPGYALSLALSFVVPKIFTSIAFDSGGVASGPMTATFLLPFAMGACDALGGNVVTDAFGVVAMVAMTPLVTIQLLGVSYKRRIKRTAPVAVAEVEEIIELA
jgi:hypothetical protein